MSVRIPDDELADQGGDLPRWQREVPEGWHRVLIREIKPDPFGDGRQELLAITYELEDGAWLQEQIDLGDQAARSRLGRIARVCGVEVAAGQDLDTDSLIDCELEVRCKWGSERRSPPPARWQNVVGHRPAHHTSEAAAPDALDGLRF